MPIRTVRQRDGNRLRTLQSLLAEPAPELLSAALLATTAEAGGQETCTPVDPVVSAGQSFTLAVSVTDSGRVVGYVLALTGSGTHIAELVVAPDYRRAGRGRALLETVIESDPPPVTVHVAAGNDAARRLYETVGFSVANRTAEQFDETDGLTLRYERDTRTESGG